MKKISSISQIIYLLILFVATLIILIRFYPSQTSNSNVMLSTTNFPQQEWQYLIPAEAGIDSIRWKWWNKTQKPQGSSKFGEQHNENQWGVVLAKNGYIIQTWGNPDYLYQSASVGKAFTKIALQLAVDEGLIGSENDLVRDYWTGETQLTASHQYLNQGHHRSLTFKHLWEHRGGFPISNGYYWLNKQDIPQWANYTGDPIQDNYAHIEPGTEYSYASGGYWRLTQALTAIWGRSLKDVLDEKLFSKMDISGDRWDWLSGKEVHDNVNFYPEMPNYGAFIDPPYEIAANPCVGGGGWVVMSPKDLARVGLLISTGGMWRGERLISDTELLAGHRGGNNSNLLVKNDFVWAQVTTQGIEIPNFLWGNK
ncbi:Beta-lactamase [Hyella patelloides LEGE 07179]|uniref:Beta-lactamase n=1 Tax=Hyella patelloides LEGE 07179 TaxID=945734 RepID=A0A563VIN0_9CYAN|nr:serine hydrolase [Hyella patelloides]VEP11249.1 Beta-lactamase [Hyella patelloides LEGE 07179]